jgi:hypothetical protein
MLCPPPPPPPPPLDNGGKPQIKGKDLWPTTYHREIPVCTFLSASSIWGSRTEAKNRRAYCLNEMSLSPVRKLSFEADATVYKAMTAL